VDEPGSQGQPSVAAASPSDIDLGPLTARVAALEQQVGKTALEASEPRIEVPVPVTGAPVPDRSTAAAIVELSTHLARVEAELAELKAKSEVRAVVDPIIPNSRPSPEAIDAALEQLTLRARDVAATEEQRLAALRELRGKTRPDGLDARLAVLDDMLVLAQNSTDPAVRADVWRQLSNVTDPRLKQPLLDALAFDKDAKAREEAAETLAGFLPDAKVEAALRQALQNDASEDVRKQAGKSLAGGR